MRRRSQRRLSNAPEFVIEIAYKRGNRCARACTRRRRIYCENLRVDLGLKARCVLCIPSLFQYCAAGCTAISRLLSARLCPRRAYLWILINGKLSRGLWIPIISASRWGVHYYYLPTPSITRLARGILIHFFRFSECNIHTRRKHAAEKKKPGVVMVL